MAEIDNSLNTLHMSANLGSYEAARSSFFTFTIDGLNGAGKTLSQAIEMTAVADPTGEDTLKGMTPEEVVRLNVVTSSVPRFSLDSLSYRRGNDVVKFAGVPTFDSGSLKVSDVVGLNTKSVLTAWQELAYNPYTRKGGRMKDYKFDCTLSEYTQDFTLIRSWTMKGCWVSKITEADFDKENDSARTLEATVEYDNGYINVNKE